MESFFLTASQFDEIELKELLLKRYHTLEFIKDMGLIEFILFVNKAREKEKEERLYQQWCAMLPQMNKYMSFVDFSDMLTGKNIDMRPAEDIIKDIEEAHRKAGKEVTISGT